MLHVLSQYLKETFNKCLQQSDDFLDRFFNNMALFIGNKLDYYRLLNVDNFDAQNLAANG